MRNYLELKDVKYNNISKLGFYGYEIKEEYIIL
jgi:hypothetical protein